MYVLHTSGWRRQRLITVITYHLDRSNIPAVDCLCYAGCAIRLSCLGRRYPSANSELHAMQVAETKYMRTVGTSTEQAYFAYNRCLSATRTTGRDQCLAQQSRRVRNHGLPAPLRDMPQLNEIQLVERHTVHPPSVVGLRRLNRGHRLCAYCQ